MSIKKVLFIYSHQGITQFKIYTNVVWILMVIQNNRCTNDIEIVMWIKKPIDYVVIVIIVGSHIK